MHSHLTQHQRIELSLLNRLGYNQRSVALVLGVNPGTICRELAHNSPYLEAAGPGKPDWLPEPAGVLPTSG
jgi:IS30 family transposase